MGVVYKAHDPLLERDVALKVMLPKVAEDAEGKIRFEREAKAIARMVHPHVVTVFDLGYHTDGSPFIAMELLRRRGPAARDAAGDAALPRPEDRDRAPGPEGLGRAHRRGHRPPRHQARQRLPHPRRQRQDHGLRRRVHEVQGDGRRDRGGNPRLHVAGAGRAAAQRGRAQRPVQRGGDALRARLGPTALPRREPASRSSTRSPTKSRRWSSRKVPSTRRSGPSSGKCLVKEVGERYQTAAAFAEALEGYAQTLPEESASAAPAPVDLGIQETVVIPVARDEPPRRGESTGDEPILLASTSRPPRTCPSRRRPPPTRAPSSR